MGITIVRQNPRRRIVQLSHEVMKYLSLSIAIILSINSCHPPEKPQETGLIMTVNGPIASDKMGVTLEHEHVTTDFIGAEKVTQPQYPANQALDKLLPFFFA